MDGRSTRWTVGAFVLVLVLMIAPVSAMASPTEPARASHSWLDLDFLWTTLTDLAQGAVNGMKMFGAPSQGGGDSATGGGHEPPPPPQTPNDLGTNIDPNGNSVDCDSCH